MVSRRNSANRMDAIIRLLLVVVLVVITYLLADSFRWRFDLTEDNRYTLSEPTEDLLDELDRPIFISCYLEGDIPPGFEELRDAVEDMLLEFNARAGQNVQFEFVDPYELASGKERADLFAQLQDRGLKSFELQDMRDDEVVRKVVWPGAFVRMGEKEVPVTFLRDQMGMDPQRVLHNSVMGVEYELANAIIQLKSGAKKRIAFIEGQGELDGAHTADIARALGNRYDLERLNITRYKVGKLREYDAIVIAKPDTAFAEVDKYKIDQYVMNGGKVLWLVESLAASMDSLKTQSYAVTMDYPLNLRDMLFRYGVRVNLDLVQDFNCHNIPILVGGGTGRSNFRNWPYFPLVSPDSDHPIAKNLGLVWFRFANSLDTVRAEGIDKTVLLKSSSNSRLVHHPHRINLQMARLQLDPAVFQNGNQAMAILLEGEFESVFKNRLAPETLQNPDYGNFREKGSRTKMIVISDGDLIANDVNPTTGQAYALGYDRFSKESFNNKTFLLNCMDYLLDDSGLFALRSKDFKLRLLEKGKVRARGSMWKTVNLILPLILLGIFGLAFNYLRKRNYSSR